MSYRQFKDCDGDTWTEVEPGTLKLTETTSTFMQDRKASIEDVSADYGPLTEIRPDVNVRALLAGVLEDMAEEARGLYWAAADRTAERVYSNVSDMFDRQVRKLREESA